MWPSAAHGDVSVDLPVTALDSVNQTCARRPTRCLRNGEPNACTAGSICCPLTACPARNGRGFYSDRAVTGALGENEAITVETTDAMSYDVQTYDMETGNALTLADVFAEDQRRVAED